VNNSVELYIPLKVSELSLVILTTNQFKRC
jgi:hypothetical protein